MTKSECRSSENLPTFSSRLDFMKFASPIPRDRGYARNHVSFSSFVLRHSFVIRISSFVIPMADLVFMMGKFPAPIPRDRSYARNHMWCQTHGARCRFGFTAYAVRLLQDVYFLDWCVDAGAEVRLRQEIGSIESSKAESALYAPMAGRIAEFNVSLLSDPSLINLENYANGWLFDMDGDASSMLSPEGYVQFLDEGWEATQRTLKGQLND